jgi:hypothetical protein
MTEKTPPAGWVVQQTVPAPLSTPGADRSRWIGPVVLAAPSFQYFNVAIASVEKAIEATSKHLARAEANDGEMSVVRGLSLGEIAALRLEIGEVKPA